MDLGRVKRIWIYFSVLRRKSLTSAQTHSSLVGLLRSDSSLRRTHDVRTLDQEVRQWTGCHWSLGSNSSVIHKRPSLLEEQTGQNGMYLHWGLGIRIVRIPNTEYRIPNSDSLSEQIFSELFDPMGLVIRTRKNSDSLSEQGSRYPSRDKKVAKKRKMALSQLISYLGRFCIGFWALHIQTSKTLFKLLVFDNVPSPNLSLKW